MKNLFKILTPGILILFTVLWVAGIVIMLIYTTDLFTKNIFRAKFISADIQLIVSILMVVIFHIFYWKNRKKYTDNELNEK